MPRVCSECSTVVPSSKKTCSDKCRSKRSRRLKRQRKERGVESAYPPGAKEIQQRVRKEAPDVAHEVIQKQLEPVVREAVTEDIMKAIRDMVGLTPKAVLAIEEDLGSDNETTRQRAYTLIMKYTAGHPALVRPPEEDRTQAIQVNFALPRPEQETVTVEVEELDTDTRQCEKCNQVKSQNEFVGVATLCNSCFADRQARVDGLLSATD